MRRLQQLSFALAFVVPLQLLLAMHWADATQRPDLLAWYPLLFLFVLMPVLDWAIGCHTANIAPEQERAVGNNRLLQAWCLLAVPVQYLCLYLSLDWFNRQALGPAGQLGWLLSQGILGGAFAINTAHELIHKNSRIEQWAGRLLLVSVGYHGFRIEHVRGHHVHVSTPDDPSSAPYGMSVWTFLPRALWHNTRNAWRLEAERLRGLALPVFSRHNGMLQDTLLWLGLVLACHLAFGLRGSLFFIAQGLLAAATLEIINYVEHYGLERRRSADGRYERTTHLHSWNSSFALSNAMLFNLQRHSDHHAYPKRRYGILRHFDDSPQLPAGYPTMFLLALCPPLWRRVVHDCLAKSRAAA